MSSLSSLTVSKQHLRKVPAMTQIVTVRNGIDVDQQLATIDAIKDDLNVASFTFRASSRCQEGIYKRRRDRAFVHAGQEEQSRSERSG